MVSSSVGVLGPTGGTARESGVSHTCGSFKVTVEGVNPGLIVPLWRPRGESPDLMLVLVETQERQAYLESLPRAQINLSKTCST